MILADFPSWPVTLVIYEWILTGFTSQQQLHFGCLLLVCGWPPSFMQGYNIWFAARGWNEGPLAAVIQFNRLSQSACSWYRKQLMEVIDKLWIINSVMKNLKVRSGPEWSISSIFFTGQGILFSYFGCSTINLFQASSNSFQTVLFLCFMACIEHIWGELDTYWLPVQCFSSTGIQPWVWVLL